LYYCSPFYIWCRVDDGTAGQVSGESCESRLTKKLKKAEKAAKKAAEEAEANALFEQAVQALKNKDFVLEADRIEFKRGSFVYVTPNTNFVSVKGEKARIYGCY